MRALAICQDELVIRTLHQVLSHTFDIEFLVESRPLARRLVDDQIAASVGAPLVAGTPGLRATRVQRVSEALGGETDLVLVTSMTFDDRAATGRVPGTQLIRPARFIGLLASGRSRLDSRSAATPPRRG